VDPRTAKRYIASYETDTVMIGYIGTGSHASPLHPLTLPIKASPAIFPILPTRSAHDLSHVTYRFVYREHAFLGLGRGIVTDDWLRKGGEDGPRMVGYCEGRRRFVAELWGGGGAWVSGRVRSKETIGPRGLMSG